MKFLCGRYPSIVNYQTASHRLQFLSDLVKRDEEQEADRAGDPGIKILNDHNHLIFCTEKTLVYLCLVQTQGWTCLVVSREVTLVPTCCYRSERVIHKEAASTLTDESQHYGEDITISRAHLDCVDWRGVITILQVQDTTSYWPTFSQNTILY